MFDLAHKGIVAWPFMLTQQQGEAFVDVPVTVRFRTFTRAELRERDKKGLAQALGKLVELVRGQASPEDIAAAQADMETVDRGEEDELLGRIVGWSGFANDGAALDYTPALGRAVIEHDPYYQAFWKALLDASRQARPKNSSPGAGGPPAPGQSTTD